MTENLKQGAISGVNSWLEDMLERNALPIMLIGMNENDITETLMYRSPTVRPELLKIFLQSLLDNWDTYIDMNEPQE